ncbi:MAG: hypothetical protein K0R48_478 [Gammaproteobacteria bacterium]|jgi:hypothetical protein|nr:hypothetical protein [Gammaproteobacteria bacterium]
MKHHRAFIRQLQKIKAKLRPLPRDNFWKFMQKSPLKGICLSLKRNKEPIRGVELYRGFLFVKDKIKDSKRETKFKREVDSFCNTVVKHYDELRNQNYQLSAEIRAQAILMKVMPDYKVIRVDDGSASSQIDLKATNDLRKHTIAIEVTQYTNSNLNRKKDPEKKIHFTKLKRDWVVHVNNNAAKEIDTKYTQKVCSLLIEIERKYATSDTIAIFTSELRVNELSKLFIQLNIPYIYGNKTGNTAGSIQFPIGEHYFPRNEENEALKKILEIAHNESIKEDNRKKLRESGANEKHLFIIILSDHEKEKYFEALVDHLNSSDKTISVSAEIDTFKNFLVIFNTANVVWVEYATYNSSGRVVSSLIKITKKEDELIFSLICNKEPYIKEAKNENSFCRL